MQVGLVCDAHVVWDCLFNTGYPGFGVPVPLFIGYLISNLILLKTNVKIIGFKISLNFFGDNTEWGGGVIWGSNFQGEIGKITP